MDDYGSLLDTLDEAGQSVLNGINDHISMRHPAYRPVDVKPTDSSQREWTLAYRKKPKTGKALCAVHSIEGKLLFRISFLTSMAQEVLLRRNEFSRKIKDSILGQTVCVVNRSCRCYGGNTPCPYRQYFWIDGRQIMACPYPWIKFEDPSVDDVRDICLLLDMQANHMAQDPRDIKGGRYAEVNRQRCGEAEIRHIDRHRFDAQAFTLSDHVSRPGRLERYAKLYHLVPMGENDGIWFYRSECAASRADAPEHSCCEVPQGEYASITISDPLDFSAVRAWNYICQWLHERKADIQEFSLDGKRTVCLTKFYKEDGAEYMKMYVPVQ